MAGMVQGIARSLRARASVIIALLGGLLALFVRWYFVSHAHVLQPLDQYAGWGDAAEYYRYAWNLLHHGTFSIDRPGTLRPQPDSWRDPAFPVFLALWMRVTNSYETWYAGVLISQAFLGALTVTCIALAVRRVLPTWLLACAVVAMAVWPHSVAMTAYVLTENLSAPLYAVAVLAISEATHRQSLWLTAAGAGVLAAAALSNAVLGSLVLPLATILFWKRLMPRRQVIVLIVVTAVPLVAWGMRNAALTNEPSSSLRADMNFVQGSWPTYHLATQLWARHDPVGIQTERAIDVEIGELHTGRLHGLKMIAGRMSLDPWTYVKWYLSKPALLWGWEIGLGSGDVYVYPTRNSPYITIPTMRAIYGVAYVMNGVLALLALAGAAVSLAQRLPPPALAIFATTALWITFVYGVLQSDPRYAIPFRGAEIALACFAVAEAAKHAKKRLTALRMGS